jgi:hypothetical protein
MCAEKSGERLSDQLPPLQLFTAAADGRVWVRPIYAHKLETQRKKHIVPYITNISKQKDPALS